MVFDKVKEIIVDQLDVDADKVTNGANIQDDLGADSLDVVDLVMSLEEEFDIEISEEDAENISTVGSAEVVERAYCQDQNVAPAALPQTPVYQPRY